MGLVLRDPEAVRDEGVADILRLKTGFLDGTEGDASGCLAAALGHLAETVRRRPDDPRFAHRNPRSEYRPRAELT